LNVSDPENLTNESSDSTIIVANKLHGDASEAQVGGQGEVRDCRDHGNGSDNVAEETITGWTKMANNEMRQCGYEENGENCP